MEKPKLILCTLGTSISNGVPTQYENLKKVTLWDDELKEFKQEVNKRVKEAKDYTKLSAEINSLNRMNIQRGDKIVFLCSDNAPGRICAKANKEVLVEKYNIDESDIEIKQIQDLQVYDSKRLREHGLKNFVKAVLSYLDNDNYKYSYEIILNPTGGYKGILPFLTILGMLYGKKIAYIFEFADDLIWLPPLPFTFNLQLYERAKPALEYIESKIAVSKEEYLAKIPNYSNSEELLFMSFTEPFGEGKITTSPLAYCFIAIDEQKEKIYIHESVKKNLNKMEASAQLKIKRLFRNCSNVLWRNTHTEQWREHTDLLVIRKDRTAERLAGFYENDIFFITHAFTVHRDYERDLREKWRKNYSDKSKFSEWIDDEDIGVDDCDRDLLSDERDLLLIEKQEWQTNKNELNLLIEVVNKELAEMQAINQTLKSDIEFLNQNNEKLKKERETNLINTANTNVTKDKPEVKGFFKRLKFLLNGK
jgi:putative CRISPR-associated protein (TIGR02619 family)